MKSTGQPLVIKRLLLGTRSLFAIGLLTTCGSSSNHATASAQKTSLLASQAFSFSQSQINKASQISYPDPSNQKALPASVKVTGNNNETVLLRASVTEGYQAYECQPSTTSKSGFAWTLQAPYAMLKSDNGTNVLHATSPSWYSTLERVNPNSDHSPVLFLVMNKPSLIV